MRISDWSSDVCSSDLPKQPARTARWVWGGAWAYFSSCRMSSVFACHPERSEGSAWPDVRFLTAFGMTHAWSTQSEPLPVLARSFDVGHAALAQLRMRGIVADVGTVMPARSDEHTSELQSLMRISDAV